MLLDDRVSHSLCAHQKWWPLAVMVVVLIFARAVGWGRGEAQESTLSWKEVRSDLTVQ